MHNDRLKIATALGYYARATDPEAATLSAAVKAHALAEYQNDIDCQIAFRKGWQKAEEHFEAKGIEAAELLALCAEIKGLLADLKRFRGDAEVREHAPRYFSAGDFADEPSEADKNIISDTWYMRRKDSGQLHCHMGAPMVFPSREVCLQACEVLRVRTGIDCTPIWRSALFSKEWKPPR